MFIGNLAFDRGNRFGAGNLSPPSDGQLWRAAVITNGGTVSAARAAVIENFILAEKAAGTWALTDDYWLLAAENEIQARTSIKQRRLTTVISAPPFDVNLGYTLNGASQYLMTNFIVGTHSVAMTGSNLRLATYEWNNIAADTFSAGYTDTGLALFLNPQNAAGFVQGNANASGLGAAYTLTVATSAGLTAVSRNGPLLADHKCFKNGVLLAFASGAPTFNSTLPSSLFTIGCVWAGGSPSSFRANTIGFACMGAALSDAQELAQYTNVQTWLGSLV